jgi:hypothetical protein
MSETGLYSGLYSTVRQMAELVDSVLLGIKAGTRGDEKGERQRLGTLLIRIAEPSSDDLVSHLLGIVVKDSRKPGFDPVELGNWLLGPSIPFESINTLETLAVILENERSTMLVKMRGR